MRLLLRGPLNVFTGYGIDCVDIARFMAKGGVDVTLWPTHTMTGLPREVAELLTKQPRRASYDVVLSFLPPFDLCRIEAGSELDWTDAAPVALAWSMWEWSKILPEDMLPHTGWADWRQAGHGWWEGLDRILVTCPMNVEAFRSLDDSVPVQTAPCGIDPAPQVWPEVRRDWSGPLRYCMHGLMSLRKDPMEAVNAWRELKDEHGDKFDAELHIRSPIGVHPKISEWEPSIKIHVEQVSHDDLVRWYHSMHVMLCPSRGEGNNKPPMQFQATGGVVLASAWSGHVNWLYPDANYAIPGRLAETNPGSGNGKQDFRVDREAFKELIWRVYCDRAEAAQKGRVAARFIRETMGWPRCAARAEALIMQTAAGTPDASLTPNGSTSASLPG